MYLEYTMEILSFFFFKFWKIRRGRVASTLCLSRQIYFPALERKVSFFPSNVSHLFPFRGGSRDPPSSIIRNNKLARNYNGETCTIIVDNFLQTRETRFSQILVKPTAIRSSSVASIFLSLSLSFVRFHFAITVCFSRYFPKCSRSIFTVIIITLVPWFICLRCLAVFLRPTTVDYQP